MRARAFLTIVAIAAMSLLPLTPTVAQRPQTREGFWISFGLGAGDLGWQCDSCTTRHYFAGSMFLRIGGTPGPKTLVGLELSESGRRLGPDIVTAGYAALTVSWFPNVRGGFFWRGGLGTGIYNRDSDSATAEAQGVAIILGLGYDWRVGRNTSITTMLSTWGATRGTLTDDVSVLNTGFRPGAIQLQVGLTLH